MKNLIFALTGLIFLLSNSAFSGETVKETSPEKGSAINVVCSPGLYDLASSWALEYNRTNHDVDVRVMPLDKSTLGSYGTSGGGIGFFSESDAPKSATADMFKMTVARDITVPIISSGNPFIEELARKGITGEGISMLISQPGSRNWGSILGNNASQPVHLYLSNEEAVLFAITKFTGLSQIPDDVIIKSGGADVIKAVQGDPYGIGFCKMINVQGADSKSLLQGIQLLPIDKNKNGKIDYMENIYDRPENFARGVWIGKYPRVLYTDVYCISDSKPESKAEVAFLKWVLAAGQRNLGENGLSDLVMSERQSKLAMFNVINVVPPSKQPYSLAGILVISISAIIALSLIISRVIYLRRKRALIVHAREKAVPLYFSKQSVNIPKGLYYDKTHTWAFMENDGMVRIGIDDFLQHVTGPITRIEMRKPGEKVRKGDMILTIIQNGKRLVVFAPISGIIKEKNSNLDYQYNLINSSPYSNGWVYRIEPSNWLRELQLMEMAEKYQAWLSNEFLRLKDFLACSLKVNRMEYEAIVLQDGGMLKDGVLEDFGPEVWEDFQSNFLDTTY
jgi:glycine cleavage system H lipoate-binding protein/ABC-type phosphate transport system substrate-binding protein